MGVESEQSFDEVVKGVHQSIFQGTFTKDEFTKIQQTVIAPGWTVGGLIEASVDLGTIKWEGDRLLSNYSRVNVDLEFTPAEESKLRKIARETGQAPPELVRNFIKGLLDDGNGDVKE